MNKNTGDGELDDILRDIAVEAANYWDGGRSRSNSSEDLENEFAKAKQLIQKYTAQEANKARLEELELTISNLHFGGGVLPNRENKKYINNRIAELLVIQNKLEGLS